MITVLLTDGAFTGLIRTLREAYPGNVRIIGLSMDTDAPHQSILDAFYVVSSHESPGYIDELIRIITAEQVEVIFPIVSEGLESLMQNESLIFSRTGARILSSPLSALQIANDKGLLYSFLQNSSDPALSCLAPVFCLADTKSSLMEAIHNILSSGKKACIKRRRGEDAAGFWVIDDQADYTSQLFYQSPKRQLSGIMLTAMLINIRDEDPIPPYMACEFLPGEEWDCDVLCMEGKLISVTTRINLSMTGGLTSVLEVRDNPYLASCCERIVSALNLSFVICISFRADAGGRFFLLEINPRIMGNIYVSALAGNNYVKMSIDLLNERPVHAVPPKNGIRTALYYDQLVIKEKTEQYMSNVFFHRLTAADREVYESYYRKSNTRLADMTFNCRIAWDEVFKSEMAIYEDCLILMSDGGCFTDPHLLMPMGELDAARLDRIFTAVHDEFDKRGWRLKVMCIDEDKLSLYENLPHFTAEPYYNDDSSDYLYDGESMRTLTGNILHKKRNHVNKFMRLYPDYEYATLTHADRDECLALVTAWCKSKDIDPDNCAESDYTMIHRLFRDFDLLEIHGGLIRTGGIVRAFSMGSLGNNNTAYVHFEKADQEIHGIYSAINQMVLQNEFPHVVAVDREEDLGIPGLRKAKQSYEPIALLKKYKTWLTDK